MIEDLTNGYKNQSAALALALPGIVSPEGSILSAVNLGGETFQLLNHWPETRDSN